MNKEAVAVADRIKAAIAILYKEDQRSESLIDDKARTTMDYKRDRATVSVKLRGEKVPATLVNKQAEGAVAEQEYKMIVATESLKAHWIRMENMRISINGLQSINRYLSVT